MERTSTPQDGRTESIQRVAGGTATLRSDRPHVPGRQQSRVVNGNGEGLARALGWFSIGLGLAEVVAPRGLAKLIGIREHPTLLRMFGLREIASGVGILLCRRPAGWLWARVGGDLMDLACLGTALKSETAKPGKTAAATMAVVGVTVLDVLAGDRLSRGRDTTTPEGLNKRAVRVQMSVTINRPSEHVYRFWRDFQNLPRFMHHLESVQVTGEQSSHWRAKVTTGATVEWDAQITEDRPNELIAWRSLANSAMEHSGMVRFKPAPGGRGTEITVEIWLSLPGGVIGATIAKLFGSAPEQFVRGDLRRLKQLMETGELARPTASLPGAHAALPAAHTT
jgi:uncharacterized membrane protein